MGCFSCGHRINFVYEKVKTKQSVWIWVLAILLVAIILPQSMQKESAVTSLVRSVPVTVTPLQEVSIDLTMTVPDKTGIIVIETIPAGWTHVTGGNKKGDTIELVIFKSSPGSVTETYVLKAPNSPNEVYTFHGIYNASDKLSYPFPDSVTTIQGSCTPDCTNKVCGSDGCGGTCGNCAVSETCIDGACIDTSSCIPYSCEVLSFECGIQTDNCGNEISCGTCNEGYLCNSLGKCVSTSYIQPPSCSFYEKMENGQCVLQGWVILVFGFIALTIFMNSRRR